MHLCTVSCQVAFASGIQRACALHALFMKGAIMSKIRNALRYGLAHNLSANKIAVLFGGSHNSWRKRLNSAARSALSVEALDAMPDTELDALIRGPSRKSRKILPDWEEERAYLELGYNLSEAHLRYQDKVGYGSALAYSSYCEAYRKHQKTIDPVFRHVHVPGEALQTDYAGFTPTGLHENGKKAKFQLFVSAFPYSHFMFAKLFYTQSTNDHIHANIASLEYAGGAPDIVTPDNLKAAVIYARPLSKRRLNEKYVAMADNYGMHIRPARVKKPQDKASVEIAVKLIQRQLKLALRDRPLMTLYDMNLLLREIIDRWNAKPMKRSAGLSRREKFDRFERPQLKPLPNERLEFLDLPVSRNVEADYHVSFDKVRYSVPFKYIGKSVCVRASERFVEIRHDNQIVVRHKRSRQDHAMVTLDAHRPDKHKAYLASKLEEWADRQAPEIAEWVYASLSPKGGQRDKARRLTKFRQMLKLYGEERIVAAVKRAKSDDALSYKHVVNMLENNMEQTGVPAFRKARRIPQLNVRGAAYFGENNNVC
jgi:transposase